MSEPTNLSWDMDTSTRDRRQQEVGDRTPMDGFTVCLWWRCPCRSDRMAPTFQNPHLLFIPDITTSIDVKPQPDVARIELKKERMGPPAGAPVAIEIYGPDFDKLGQIAENIRRRIGPIKGEKGDSRFGSGYR